MNYHYADWVYRKYGLEDKFVFLYAGLFENSAVVNGWYVYGRSLLVIGDVPLSVPLVEMDVLIVGLLGLIFCLGRSRPLQAGQEPFSLGV